MLAFEVKNNLVATLQLMAQRNQLMVYLWLTDAVAAQESMNLEGGRGVQPAGIVLISPLGVKTKILKHRGSADGIEEVHGIRLRIVQNLADGAGASRFSSFSSSVYSPVSRSLAVSSGQQPFLPPRPCGRKRICTSIHLPAYSSG